MPNLSPRLKRLLILAFARIVVAAHRLALSASDEALTESLVAHGARCVCRQLRELEGNHPEDLDELGDTFLTGTIVDLAVWAMRLQLRADGGGFARRNPGGGGKAPSPGSRPNLQ
jgi:hypothetical protein